MSSLDPTSHLSLLSTPPHQSTPQLTLRMTEEP